MTFRYGWRMALLFGLFFCHEQMTANAQQAGETKLGTQITALPYTIHASGVYVLSQDFTNLNLASGSAIQIAASNVVLNLNGHTLSNTMAGAGTIAYGVFATDQSNITVCNGTVQGFMTGVALTASNLTNPGTTSYGHMLEKLNVNVCTYEGISVAANESSVRACQVEKIGGSTLLGNLASAYGIDLLGSGLRCLDCDVSQVWSNVSSDMSFAIYLGSANDVFVTDNRMSVAGYGLYFDSASTGRYRHNLATGMLMEGYVGGTDAGKNIIDSNSDGVDDDWEVKYFSTVNVNLTAPASGCGGLTNLQAYQLGLNPNDYYNGDLNIISIVSGNNQTAAPNVFTANPLVVAVKDGTTNAPKVNAPITFSSSTGMLANSVNGTPSSTLQMRTDANGTAAVYFQMPTSGSYAQVTATASSGTNSAQVVFTEGIAQLFPDPANINLSVDQGEVRERTLKLVNNTSQSINYVVNPTVVNFTGTSSDAPQNSSYPEYNWTDSATTGGPIYVWNDISATGSLLNNFFPNRDDGYQQLSLPFSFPFYGNSFTSAYVSTNGYLTFGTGSNYYNSYPLPSTSMVRNLIAPLYKDLNLTNSGNVYYKADFGKFTVQFDSVPPISGSGIYTYQVVLYSSGNISFFYKTMTGAVNDATAGIQNGDANSPHGRQVAYKTTYLHSGLAVRFHLVVAAPFPWLSIQNSAGTVATGQSANVDVTLMSTIGLPAGTYTSTIHLKNDAGNTVGQDVPVSFIVSGNGVVDADDDGLPDKWEMQHFGNLNQGPTDDPDHDGLNNYLEYRLGSDPLNPDTNGDGIMDGIACRLGIGVTNLDMDGDGVSNSDERLRGTNPFLRDSDGDGVPDGQDAFPLDATRAQGASVKLNDGTPLPITLNEPTNAVPLN